MKHLVPLIEDKEPGILVSEDYQVLAVNTRFKELSSRPFTPGKTHCYELSHGYDAPCHEHSEDCPLKRCKEENQPQHALHIHHTNNGPEYCEINMHPLYVEGELIGYFESVEPIEQVKLDEKGDGLCGQSQAFRNMLSLINRAAPTDVSVLLQGESGTGKELAANALHRASLRATSPFVVLECSGLTESLFESELFGYVKGAFTGANRDKPGLVDAANGGTLFLDEIGDIPLNLQVKLLRLLETGAYRPVGSIETRKTNFRLISATHKSLDTMVSDGEFRHDLYYRIAAFPITLPALRERLEDLPLLVEVLLGKLADEMGQAKKRLAPSALNALKNYHFPGNIRELRNILQRAILMSDNNMIEPKHLDHGLQRGQKIVPAQPAQKADSPVIPLKEVEAQYIQTLASRFAGNHTELAQQLGISERTLYRKLQSTNNKTRDN